MRRCGARSKEIGNADRHAWNEPIYLRLQRTLETAFVPAIEQPHRGVRPPGGEARHAVATVTAHAIGLP